MENIFKWVVLAIVVGGLFYGMIYLAEGAFSGQEQFECYQWQKQAKTYEGFYLTTWQSEQCAHYNIKIDALIQ